jgi:hypothetical protein
MSPINSARLGAAALLATSAVSALSLSVSGCAADQATNGTDYDAGGGGGAGDDSGSGGQTDTGTTPYDAGQPIDTGTTPGQCVAQCNVDTDCQNSCPLLDGGVSCCDTASKTCFASGTPACPASVGDGGGPPPGY